jgi:hypothetical protein
VSGLPDELDGLRPRVGHGLAPLDVEREQLTHALARPGIKDL